MRYLKKIEWLDNTNKVLFSIKNTEKKNDSFKEWSRCRNAKTWPKYKKSKYEAKKVMSKAKTKSF